MTQDDNCYLKNTSLFANILTPDNWENNGTIFELKLGISTRSINACVLLLIELAGASCRWDRCTSHCRYMKRDQRMSYLPNIKHGSGSKHVQCWMRWERQRLVEGSLSRP